MVPRRLFLIVLRAGWIEDPVHNSRGATPLYRLANMSDFEVGKVNLAKRAGNRQVTKLADRIERPIVVRTMRVVIAGGRPRFHSLP